LRDEAAGVVSSISKGENKPLQVEANACELKSTVLSPGDFVVTLSDGTAIKAAANTSIGSFCSFGEQPSTKLSEENNLFNLHQSNALSDLRTQGGINLNRLFPKQQIIKQKS
jgi:hypothetical protein